MAIVFENPLPYDIRIVGSANKGFILTAGCCTCVFSDKKELLNGIEDYINDPEKMEKAYNESTKHARPQVVESGVGMAQGNTLAVPMSSGDCCQEDCGPDQRR